MLIIHRIIIKLSSNRDRAGTEEMEIIGILVFISGLASCCKGGGGAPCPC